MKCSKTKELEVSLDGLHLVGILHCQICICICICMHLSIFLYFRLPGWGKSGKALVYMYSVISVYYAYHVHAVSLHIYRIYFHISLGRESSNLCNEMYHVSIKGSHCCVYERKLL